MERPSTPKKPKEHSSEQRGSADGDVLIVDMDENDVRLSTSKGRRAARPKGKTVSLGSRVVGEHKLV